MSEYQEVLYAHQGTFRLSPACLEVLGLTYTTQEERLSLPFVPVQGGHWNLRCDPVLHALYKRNGSVWISDDGTEIRLTLVPCFGTEYIEIRQVFAAEYTHEEVHVEFDHMYRDAVHLFLRENKDAIPLPEDMARFHQHIGFVDEAFAQWSERFQTVRRMEEEWAKEREERKERESQVLPPPQQPQQIQQEQSQQQDEGVWQTVRGRGVIRRQVIKTPQPVMTHDMNLFAILEN